MTDSDFERLETKLDRLADAVSRLVVIEERQSSQGQRTGALEQRMSTVEEHSRNVDKKLDQWVNRGVGMWAIVCLAATAVVAILKIARP